MSLYFISLSFNLSPSFYNCIEIVSMASLFCLLKKIVQVLYVSKDETASAEMSVAWLTGQRRAGLTYPLTVFRLTMLPRFLLCSGTRLGSFGVKEKNVM